MNDYTNVISALKLRNHGPCLLGFDIVLAAEQKNW